MNKINWVDLFVLILLLRIGYISTLIGVGRQVFPLVSLSLILIITIFLYDKFGAIISSTTAVAPSTGRFLSYVIISIIFAVAYRMVIRFISTFFKEAGVTGGIEKVGGLILGLFRATLLIGLCVIGFALTPVRAIDSSVRNSISGMFFIEQNFRLYCYIKNLALKDQKTRAKGELSKFISMKKEYMFDFDKIKRRSYLIDGFK
ncbi:MAG: CvpA family protein [Candidatus Omnitrophota bacterium]